MRLNNKKVLVTGADGFIGSHLVEALVKCGARVRAFVFYNSFGSWGWLDDLPDRVKNSIEIFSGDIRDPHGVQKAVHGTDVVFHLAALISIPFSYHSPDAFIDTNVKGTLNVLQSARSLNVERLVHTSTSEVYGTAQFVPITEKHPVCGQSPYSASKIGADQIAMSFHHSFNTPVSILRPFNTFGPRQSARAVIPTIATQILNGSRNIQLGLTDSTRDFSYVSDTVNAFLSVAESEKVVGQIINSGSNFEISIFQTAELIAKILNKKIFIEKDKKRLRPAKSEVYRLWSDNSKLKNLTGWKPEFAGQEGFERALKKTIDWYSNPKVLAKYKSHIYNI